MVLKIYEFERYRNGRLMAEGGRVRAYTLEGALRSITAKFLDCPGDTFELLGCGEDKERLGWLEWLGESTAMISIYGSPGQWTLSIGCRIFHGKSLSAVIVDAKRNMEASGNEWNITTRLGSKLSSSGYTGSEGAD